METKTCGVGEQTQRGVLAEGWGPAWLAQDHAAGHASHPLGCSPKLNCPFVQSHRGVRHLGHLPAMEMPCSKPILHLSYCHEALTVLCYHLKVLLSTSGAQCCSVPQVMYYKIARLDQVCVYIMCSCPTLSEDPSPETSCQPLVLLH